MADIEKPDIEVVVKSAKKKVAKKPAEEKAEPKIDLPAGAVISKGGTYTCVEKCYIGMRIYKEGDTYESEPGEVMSKCFEKVKRFVEVDE